MRSFGKWRRAAQSVLRVSFFFRESNECLPILFRPCAFIFNIPQSERGGGGGINTWVMLNYLKAYNCRLSCKHSPDLHDGQSRFPLISGAATKAKSKFSVRHLYSCPENVLSVSHSYADDWWEGIPEKQNKKSPRLARIPPFRVYLLIKFLQLYILDHWLSAKAGLSICMGIESKYQARQIEKIKSLRRPIGWAVRGG